MLPRSSQRRVSQERVMGISFVDILIQAVFVLLLALMVGYIDPAEMEKIEKYEAAGKDLCVKLKQPGSPEACREYVKDQKIGLIGEFDGIGTDVCKRLGATTIAECQAALDSKFEKGSQLPCLKAPSQNSYQPSTKWEIRSPNEIVFKGFFSQYKDYLQERGDSARLAQVLRWEGQVSKSFTPNEIKSAFGFIREPACFHEVSIDWTVQISSEEMKVARQSLWYLRGFQR
jgi:hypothetical protein